LSGSYVTLNTNQTITGEKNFDAVVVIQNLTYPSVDGNPGEFLKTDGAGNLSFDIVNSYDSAKVQLQIDSDFALRTTTELTEGTNLYFTDTRARNAISVSGDLSYDPGTGIISYTDIDSASFTSQLAGSTTTELTEGNNLYFTNARARNAISVSGDLSYDPGTGIISYTDIDSASFTSQLAAATTTDLTEGTNLYFTNTRARNAISVSGDLSYDAGTGIISYTDVDSASFTSQLAGSTTTNLAEGTNLYYTTTRANSAIDARVTKTFVDALNINADQLDGLEAAAFLLSGATDNYTSGTLTFNSGTTLTAAAGATVNFNNTTGTAPFVVASTTLISNLNADKVDGFNGIGVYDRNGTLLNG